MLKLSLALLAIFSLGAGGQEFDTAIVNGRVLDPETGLEAIRSIGIRDGRIAAISVDPLRGKTAIDAKGLVLQLHLENPPREINHLRTKRVPKRESPWLCFQPLTFISPITATVG